ncbi:MAG TPA: DVUA0089 family protein [Longimicrobium sp.]|nr:DVUA0089 family protein [Longimicrobium sp.]
MRRRAALCIPALVAALALGACEGDSTGADEDFRDCPIHTTTIGTVEAGVIGPGSCEVEIEGQVKYVEVYLFQLTTTRIVGASLLAADDELDPYLYLYNENGVLLAENDDYDVDTLDAAFLQQLPAGEYFLVASSLSTSAEAPDDHGQYLLETEFF